MRPFYHLPRPWNPGYVIPDYVMAEPMGRGTFTTKWLPRGTISTLLPNEFAQPIGKKLLGRGDAGLGSLGASSLSGHSLAGHSLAGSSLGPDAEVYDLVPLGATGAMKNGATANGVFGATVTRRILATMGRLPAAQRPEYLRRVLDGIDKRLAGDLARAQKSLPLDAALAKVLDTGFYREIAELGRKRSQPRRGLLGFQPLGEDGTQSEPWDFSNITRDHRRASNMFYQPRFQTAWNHAMSSLSGEAKSKVQAGQAPFAKFNNISDGNRAWGIYWNGSVLSVNPVPPNPPGFWSKAWSTVKSVGYAITQIPAAVYAAGKATLGYVKDAACALVSTEAGKLAAAGGAAAAGAPPQAGYAGAQVASSMCGGAVPQNIPIAPASSGLPSWVLPAAAVAGGAAVLYAVLRKKG